LGKTIQGTESCKPTALSEEDLSLVNAAGVPEIMGLQSGGESDDDPWWHN
jgi:hypothetical protein